MNQTTDTALDAAASAAAAHAATTPAERAALLRAMADHLDAAAPELIAIAAEESHLPDGRLTGELARTTFQLRFFADQVRDGSCFDAVIEHADPDFALGPRPDLRRVSEPIGPVLVFAASNFPFAFSVAGGDTASALAAGCPVVVKAHPGHPRLSTWVGELLVEAGAPVSVIHGIDEGRDALTDPRIRAAAFTGSTPGGRALLELATSGRPDPIPFFGELGSVNPVFVSAGAVAARGQEIVDGFVASFTLGVGQFCTKPGVLHLPVDHGLTEALVDAVGAVDPAPMLGDWIFDRYQAALDERRTDPGFTTLHVGEGSAPTLLAASSDVDALAEECFGPASVIVEYDDVLDAARRLDGSLTATIHAEPGEEPWLRSLLDVIVPRVGRVVCNGWPTGVAVSAAMHHGGPWPAATSPLHGSVGGNAIARFLRPVSYQDVPDALLPPALQDANPLSIRRRIDGAHR